MIVTESFAWKVRVRIPGDGHHDIDLYTTLGDSHPSFNRELHHKDFHCGMDDLPMNLPH